MTAVLAPSTPKPLGELRPRRVPEHWWGYLLLLPAVVLVLGLVLYPVGYSFWLSLHSKHAYMPIQNWVGLDNFIFFLTDYDGFWRSLWLGTIYAFGTVTLQVIVGVAAALVLNETFVGRGFIRGLTLFPYMLPTIVVVILMRWLFNDSIGVVKYLLESTVVTRAMVWFAPETIMLTMILVSTWTFFPFVVIGVLARLQTIDPELYAAAQIDGAGAFRRFVHITLPQIASVLFVVVLLRFMFMFTKFDTIWLFAGAGGLGSYVRTLPIYTFIKSFGELQVGMGAALAVIMFAMIAAFVTIYFRLFTRSEEM
ncbi:MAG: sugar ABC transporter permease [Rhodospirillales bacterium]|nr:sugar ABC transporter permease [Rhodospirillales bacterium]